MKYININEKYIWTKRDQGIVIEENDGESPGKGEFEFFSEFLCGLPHPKGRGFYWFYKDGLVSRMCE